MYTILYALKTPILSFQVAHQIEAGIILPLVLSLASTLAPLSNFLGLQ